MKNRHLLNVGLLSAALLCSSVLYTGCGSDDDNATPSGQESNDMVLVSELKCTVDEFATKYQTLKKGEKVTVTLTDVSDANIAQVSETLKKMSASTLSKASGSDYIIALVLQSVDNALKTIPADAFKGVEVLQEIVIPACVEVIKSDAFAECVNLISAKILGEDTKVDEKAFENANSEIKIEQVGKEEVVTDNLLKPSDIVAYVAASNEDVVTLNMALETYDHTEVRLAISKIEGGKKVKLVIPEGVKELSIDPNDERLPSSEEYMYVVGFSSPQLMQVHYIPENSALVSVEIPNGTKIGKYAFNISKNLTSVTIPEGVTEIGDFAFEGCSSLANITIPKGVTEIGGCAFAGCSSLACIIIPEGVTGIGRSAFAVCSSLASIELPNSLKTIGFDAFDGCSSLVSINLPNSVTEIDEYAFYGTSITSVSVSPDCELATNSAFNNGCLVNGAAYYTITFPHEIEETLNNCPVEEVVLCVGSYNHESVMNALATTNKKVHLIIPEGVTDLSLPGIQENNSLLSVRLPKTIKNIGPYSFSYCKNLSSVNFPEGLVSIGAEAFSLCYGLSNVTLPKTLKTIGEYAFNGDPIETLLIPESVEELSVNILAKFGDQNGSQTLVVEGNPTFLTCDMMMTCEKIIVTQETYDKYHEEYPQMIVKK